MKKSLGPLLDLRPGERRVTLLLAANYYLLLLFYYLVKPARDSLFLIELEPDKLPLAYMLTALAAVPVMGLYTRLSVGRRLDRMALATALILAVNLVLLHWLFQFRGAWVFYMFYAWVGVSGGLVTSQFWLMTNAMFDSTEAKRLFPVLGLGGIAGAFTGGEITSFLINTVGIATADLLYVAAGVLVLCAGAVYLVGDRGCVVCDSGDSNTRTDDRSSDLLSVIKSILRSRHLSVTVGILALTVMTASFVDFQFKAVSWQAFSNEADLTSFLGRFYGRMSLLSLLVQIFLVSRLIRRFGTGGVVLILPGVLALGAMAFLLAPGLIAAMVLRGSDITFKYSLDKTSRELLFLPIPLALKQRTKVFIDLFVDRWARGLAGGLLLLMTAVLKFDLKEMTLVTLGLLACWLVLAFMARQEYVNSFRRTLARREIDLSELRSDLQDAGTIEVLVGALSSDNPREVTYALGMLKDVSAEGLVEAVKPLLSHEAPDIRQRALNVLANNGDADNCAEVGDRVDDPILSVRVAAVAFLLRHGTDDVTVEGLLSTLLAGSARQRSAALAYLSDLDDVTSGRDLVDRLVVDAVLSDETPTADEGRRVLAGLPWTPAGCGVDLWDQLLDDADSDVTNAAIAGLARRGEAQRVDWLIQQLDKIPYRLSARSTLAQLATSDDKLIARLGLCLQDEALSARARTEICRCLSAVPRQASVDLLLKRLAGHNPELRFDVLKALGKLRSKHRGLKFDRHLVSREISIEAARYSQLLRLVRLLPQSGPTADLLARTIVEIQQLRLESVFRLLGLLYPARDLLTAYHGAVSEQRVVRANAQEFLDSLLTGTHRTLVNALLEENQAELEKLDRALAHDGPLTNTAQALEFLGASCDPWLAATAIAAGGQVENPAADVYLKRSGADMLTVIEKVLILQTVDVFSDVPSDQLAALAAISSETSVLAGDVLYREHDRPDALYLVLSGQVRLHQADRMVSLIGKHDTFGTWALFDDEPRVMSATAEQDTRLLRIDRNAFSDLLADDVRIAQGIIRTVARRLRNLAGRVS